MTTRTILFSIAAALLVSSCGDVPNDEPDAPFIDALMIDAMRPSIDGPLPVAGPDRHGLVSAAGQVSGGGYTLVFELGHATGQDTRTGGGFVLETGSTVTP